jgi:hypothetical protein
MSRSQAFRPVCLQLEERVVLSEALPRTMTIAPIMQVARPRSMLLKFKGAIAYGYTAHHDERVGTPISPTISLGDGYPGTLAVNGTKVPTDNANDLIRPVEGQIVAYTGPSGPVFYTPATLRLALHRGVVTLDLTPVTPGSSTLDFVVVSGSGPFGVPHGAGTITFGSKGAVFQSNKFS